MKKIIKFLLWYGAIIGVFAIENTGKGILWNLQERAGTIIFLIIWCILVEVIVNWFH